jgi:hypothetical protein
VTTKKITKSKAVKSKTPAKTTTKTVEKGTRTLYYAYSVGCGWCKKTDPIIDELNAEGWNIQKLDLAVKENQEVINEVKQKYSQQCGTPYLVDADTGNSICGFREKGIIEKWANGEEIPIPPRPKSPPPRPPFFESSQEEENKWKKEYAAWLEENNHLPANQKKTAEEILTMPRPKSEPPRPPVMNATDDQLNVWKTEYNTWKDENPQLMNLQPADAILERMSAARSNAQSPADAGQSKPAPGPIGMPVAPGVLVPPSQHKSLINTKYYYLVEADKDVPVYADESYIRSLEHQYYIREDGKLTKVVGDSKFDG